MPDSGAGLRGSTVDLGPGPASQPALRQPRAALPGPEWVRKKGLFLTLRLLLLSVLTAIIITSLLGFQNLLAYIAQAASLAGLFLVLFWVIWQVVKAALEHAVPPQKSLTLPHLRRQEELLRKNYLAIVKVVVFFWWPGCSCPRSIFGGLTRPLWCGCPRD